jgi:hypothetical protein
VSEKKPDTTPEEYAEFIYGVVFEFWHAAPDGRLPFNPFVERVADVIRWAVAQERRRLTQELNRPTLVVDNSTRT